MHTDYGCGDVDAERKLSQQMVRLEKRLEEIENTVAEVLRQLTNDSDRGDALSL
eukprot:SAG31_NODE_8846_length_1376_cov_1.525450_1_plen_54_part_00